MLVRHNGDPSAKGKVSTYFFATINVAIYAYLTFNNHLYGEFMLNAFYYIPMNFIGFYLWSRHKDEKNGEVEGKALTPKQIVILLAATAVIVIKGFERWAKLNNLKEAARTFNYLSENNLLNYEDFQQHVSDVDASVKAADQRITQINSELSTQKIIQKHCDSYRLCRKVIEDCKSAKNPKAYRTKHQAEYQLHDSLKKELQDLGVTKIPSSNKIQKRIEHLESEQAATVREKKELQKKQKTLDIIRQNFTALLDAPQISNNDISRTVASALQH